MPICVNLWSIKNICGLTSFVHRLSHISILIPNSHVLFPHVSDFSLQRLRFWVPTSQMYQHRTLGTSRRHGVHHHTTPFHSTAGEATLSLPRRAVLALWGSTSKTHFVILLFVILLKIRIFSQNLEITESHIIILYYIIYYNILYNIIFINNIPFRSCTIIYSPKSLNFNKITK